MKSKKLSDLMFGNYSKTLKVRDYTRIDNIFKLYLIKHFDGMAKDIFFYKASEFIVDITIYLQMNYKSQFIKTFLFEDIMDEYHLREPLIKAQLDLRKERKKYGL